MVATFLRPTSLYIAMILGLVIPSTACSDDDANFTREKLVAWCIVPFDSQQRGPAERAAMVDRLGLRRIAYDWRAKHVESFEEEILEYKKHNIEYFAFWGEHEKAFKLFVKYDLHPQIWRMMGQPQGETQAERVANASASLLPLVKRAEKMGCKLGIYNHGGWSGQPENMVAVCNYLRKNHAADHVGIVYNLHHAHEHMGRLRDALELMRPYLLCLNLNGMNSEGDKNGNKILPIGEGELDLQWLSVIREICYDGPIGIIGHTQDDVELRLKDNLAGLEWLLRQAGGATPGPKPDLKTYRRPAK